MGSSSAIYFYFVIAIALWSVYSSRRLSRLYRIPFLRDFFFFILAFIGYGFLNFTGQVFLANALSTSSYYRTLGDLIVFTLAIPLLITWLYFYLMFVTRMCRINISRKFKIGYWVVNAVLVLSNFKAIQVLIETQDPNASGAILMERMPVYLAVFFGASIVPLVFPRRIPNSSGRRFARIISVMYISGFACLVIFGDILTLSFYSDRFLYLAFLSVIYFFINIPPLTYMSVYLRNHSGDLSYPGESGGESLEDFASEFKLTKREQEVMGLLVQGMSNEEIAQDLYIAAQTVKNNVSAIYRKTGVKNRVQLGNILRNYEEGEN